MEIWVPIKNYENYYEVSNYGNVRSLDRNISYPDGHTQFRKGKKIKPVVTKWGYLQIKLNKNHTSLRKHVHDLVAEAFIPNPNSLSEVNHKDHNKLNNRVDNLEWITHKDNIIDMVNYYDVKNGNNKHVCPIYRNPKSPSSQLCYQCYAKK